MILFGVGLFLTVGGSTANAEVNSDGTYTLSSEEKSFVDNPPSGSNYLGYSRFDQFGRYITVISFSEDMSTSKATSVILQISNRNLVPIKYNNLRVYSGAEKNYEVWAVDKRVNQVVVFYLYIEKPDNDGVGTNEKDFIGEYPHKRYNISTPPSPDACPDMGGNQPSVPSGYVLSGGKCVLESNCDQSHKENDLVCDNGVEYEWKCKTVDVCSNMEGDQSSVPYGHTQSGGACYSDRDYDCINGTCYEKTDLCENLEGNQTSLPRDYSSDEGWCGYTKGSIEVLSIDTSGLNEKCDVSIRCPYNSPNKRGWRTTWRIDSGTEIDMNECKGKATGLVARTDSCAAPAINTNWSNTTFPYTNFTH
jgi:hypothetical protein